jgi:hypothetical protein
VLPVRAGKQNKQREVPLHHSTIGALREYARLRDAGFPAPSTPAFFTGARGRRMGRGELNQTFIELVRQVGLDGRGARARPRPHDLRHAFAVRTLLDWHRASGITVDAFGVAHPMWAGAGASSAGPADGAGQDLSPSCWWHCRTWKRPGAFARGIQFADRFAGVVAALAAMRGHWRGCPAAGGFGAYRASTSLVNGSANAASAWCQEMVLAIGAGSNRPDAMSSSGLAISGRVCTQPVRKVTALRYIW